MQVEAGVTRRGECYAALQGFDAVPETFDGFFAERLQAIDNAPVQGKYQVAQRSGRINIDEKRIISGWLKQCCISPTHTARGDQRQIIAVGHLPNKIFALLFAVAEILGGFIAAAYKGIFSVVTYSRLLLRKDNYYKIIIKRKSKPAHNVAGKLPRPSWSL